MIVAFLLAATAAKLVLAVFAGGTLDVQNQLLQARAWARGGDMLDSETVGNPAFFPTGHFVIVRAALAAAELSGTPFAFWIKVPAILADLGVALLLLRVPAAGAAAALLFMANPVTLLLAVHHGQVHTVAAAIAAAIAALALALAERGLPRSAAVVRALAASVRQHLAALVLPLLRATRGDRLQAAALFAAVLFVVNAPLLLGSEHSARITLVQIQDS